MSVPLLDSCICECRQSRRLYSRVHCWWLIVAVWLGLAIAQDRAVSAEGQVDTHISFKKWIALKNDVQSRPGVQCKDDNSRQLVCDSTAQHTIWVFALPGHPAYPAVSQGTMVVTGHTIGIERQSMHAGSPSKFGAWIKKFEQLDHRQVEEWKQMLTTKQDPL